MIFKDRIDAGKQLAKALVQYANQADLVVLALPRGGVPVAYEIAEALNASLDVFVVRKLGVPTHEELAMGAIASRGTLIVNRNVVEAFGIDESRLEQVAQRELMELTRREKAYRGEREPLAVKGKKVILVDDGLATGASMRAAIAALKTLSPASLIVAVPTGPRDVCRKIEGEVDELVCLTQPEPYESVGTWYVDFSQTDDDEVRELLSRAEMRFMRSRHAETEKGTSYEHVF
ncbi:phosphoribosyltransferase [Desulfomonile tiedjei]|uniref:Putative phosphoribosyltransferase n=1 Tax=Desulfomonile tiedjei (strain ATCC 49306 / DSM 6799 / DCB-1) TaxID=706587 RepID=I4C0Y6_DESTA|nr:phosphoribosyltransferase [Desulfomonile tiedjei]AFM23227.1 putative phosphoribosyltransferase [Desulfomonile tiedjei DSM 6799]